MRHPSDDAHAHPTAGNLARLRDLRDLEVADDQPDVRGWPVHTSDGHRVGEVHDLLVDTSALRVRYLDVEIDLDLILGSPESRHAGRQETIPGGPGDTGIHAEDHPTLSKLSAAGVSGMASVAGMVTGLPPTAVAPMVTGTYGVGAPVAEDGTAVSNPHRSMGEHFIRESLSDEENRLSGEPPAREGVRAHGGRRHILIPIGRARLDREDDRVFVDGLKSEAVLELPEYGHGPVSRELEAEVLQRFDRGYVHSPERDFYSHSLYDQDTFYGARRSRTGEETSTRQEREVREDATLPIRGRS
ncbi:MAG TPA: PRC-barrel domain-containing protein [Thermoanaerobaculia bacterium]|nr:PRC-barrel domain-containing protein [Thermoanaerobaculia bacterium]